MSTPKTITLHVSVNPDMTILTKLASDYELRATTHPNHRAMYEATNLTVQKLAKYFATALWYKAKGCRLATEGNRIGFSRLVQRLHFPMGFCRHIMSIGNVETPEYRILVIEGLDSVKDVEGNVVTKNPSFLLSDDEMLQISEDLFMLRNFMPTATKQYKFDMPGDDAMFGVVEYSATDTLRASDICLNVFTGKAFDDKYLEITAVLGLKPARLNSAILYPNVSMISLDAIRTQFETGEGFKPKSVEDTE